MNDDKATGFFDEVKGKIKQGIGELTGNESLANSGAADQVKGNVQQTWGSVKDTASDVTGNTHSSMASEADATHADAHNSAADLRNKVTSGAERLKESFQSKLDDFESKH